MIPGGWEWLLILVIVLVIFGAGKLPRVMGDMGKGVKSFKKGLKDPDDVHEDVDVTERDSSAGDEDKKLSK